MKDISAMTEEKEVQSLEKAVEIMEKPFLYVQEKNGLKIEQMTVMSGGSDVNPELSLTYFKDNLPYFSLSIFAIEEENKEFDGEGQVRIQANMEFIYLQAVQRKRFIKKLCQWCKEER